jgi:hypothetical protein
MMTKSFNKLFVNFNSTENPDLHWLEWLKLGLIANYLLLQHSAIIA